MIVVFESICHDGEHSMFNAGLLEAALLASPAGRVIFLAHESHLPHVRECMPAEPASRIEWRPAKIAPRRATGIRERVPHDWELFTSVWRLAEEVRANAVICTGTSETGLLAAKARLGVARSSRPVLMVFHSTLPELLYSAKRRAFLGRGNPSNLKLVVLGDHIRAEIVRQVPSVAENLYWITHPYPLVGAPDSPANLRVPSPRFGFLGLGSRAKGFPDFLRLVEDTSDVAAEPASFHLVGRVAEDCRSLFSEFRARPAARRLDAGDQDSRVPLDQYRQRLQALDYVVLLNQSDHYRYICSGAALDAVWAVKPILAVNSGTLSEMFHRFGDIGYLCRDYEELRERVRRICEDPQPETYSRHAGNLLAARRAFQPRAIAAELATVAGL